MAVQTERTNSTTEGTDSGVPDVLYRIGNALWRAVAEFFDMLYLLANALGGVVAVRSPYFWRSLIQQLYFTAVQAFLLANVIGLALGVLAVLPLLSFGLSSVELQATVMRVVLFHQLVPLMVALVVIGRSGTAITSELGDMQAKGVVDSLLLMGVEPHHFLVLPRILGMVIALPLLTLWADLASIVGGAVYNELRGAAGVRHFLDACLETVEPLAVLQTTFMVMVFALAIALVHCHYGLRVQTSTDVQRSLAMAFVRALLSCVGITVLFGVLSR